MKKSRNKDGNAFRGMLIRIGLSLAAFAVIIFFFLVYYEGSWHVIYSFYNYFLDIKRLRVFIASFGPFSAIVFIIIQTLQVVVAPVPGEITGFVGGFLFGNIKGVLYSTIGLTIGSCLAFAIARRYGMKYVERIVKKQYIDKFNYFATHKGLYIAFIFYLIPGFPKDSLCYLLGLTHIKFLDFLLMNIIGRFPGTFMLTLQGTAVQNGNYKQFVVLLAVSMVAIFLFYFLRNHIIQILSFLRHKLLHRKHDAKGEKDSIYRKEVKGMSFEEPNQKDKAQSAKGKS